MKHLTRLTAALVPLALAGCGTLQQSASYDREFKPQSGMKVEIGPVLNMSGSTNIADIVPLFRDALGEELTDNNIQWNSTLTGTHLVLSAKIVEYVPGTSIKRWIVPGWGSAAMTVYCELKDSSSRTMLGWLQVRRTITVAGFNGWHAVMCDVADEIADQLEEKLKQQ